MALLATGVGVVGGVVVEPLLSGVGRFGVTRRGMLGGVTVKSLTVLVSWLLLTCQGMLGGVMLKTLFALCRSLVLERNSVQRRDIVQALPTRRRNLSRTCGRCGLAVAS